MPDKGEEAHVTFSTNGLTRLKGGLTKAGLDARFFAWPPADGPNRPPYRGLKPLEAEDAGIFLAYPVCCQYDESVIICRSGLPRLSNNASRFSAGFSR